MSDEPRPRRDSDRRVVPWLLLGLVVLFGSLYVAAYLFTSDRIPQGTTVSGIRVGGLLPAAAEQRLRDGLGRRAAEPVIIEADGHRTSAVPARMGLSFDVRRTVATLGGGRSWQPRRMWHYVVGGKAVPPVLRVDRSALAAFVDGVAGHADRPASEGRVTFADGTATPHFPDNGTVVDRPRAAAALRSSFLVSHRVVELPTVVDRPTISRAAVSSAMNTFANPAVSGPVVVRLDGEGVSVGPEDFTDALSMAPQGDRLVPHLDAAALSRVVAPKLQQVVTARRDATVRLVDGRPHVVPARAGVGFDPQQVTARFLGVLTRTGAARVLDVPPVVDPPHVTTAQATGWGITRRVSSSSTQLTYAAHVDAALARAAARVDGAVLPPGGRLDLTRVLGTGAVGGEAGQVAAAVYDAAVSAGLEVEGLVLSNPSQYGVLVQVDVVPATGTTAGTLHVVLWSH